MISECQKVGTRIKVRNTRMKVVEEARNHPTPMHAVKFGRTCAGRGKLENAQDHQLLENVSILRVPVSHMLTVKGK